MFPLHAQSPDFSQVHTNYIYLNPSFSGMQNCPRVYTSYRNKKYTPEVTYLSNYFSFDMYAASLQADIGVSFTHDVEGSRFSKTTFHGIFAKEFKLKKRLYFKTALAIGGGMTGGSPGGLVFSDMLDPLLGELRQTAEPIYYYQKGFFDSEVGLLLFNDRFYAGITGKHLNHIFISSQNNSNPFVPQVSAHAGTEFSTTKGFTQRTLVWLRPFVNVTITRISSYMHVGMIAQKNQLQIGAGYRQNLPVAGESFVVFVAFVEKKFKFAYNCDVSIKSHVGSNFNTHEVSFSYQFDCYKKRKKNGGLRAPM